MTKSQPSTQYLVFAAIMMGTVACDNVERIETFTLDSQGIETLLVDAGSGGVVIDAAEIDNIEVWAEVYGEKTTIARETANGAARIETKCPIFGSCGVSYVVTMPANIAVTVDTGSGGIEINGLQASVRADTGSGGVNIQGVAGAVVEIDTGSGGVTATDLDVAAASIETGSGSVNVGFVAAAPESVSISTGSGGVELNLPNAEYNVDTSVGSGDVFIDGITVDENAPRHVAISTGSGSVRIQGH